MNSLIREFVLAFEEISKVLSIPCIIFGALNCFFGYKIFRVMCGIKGFFAGAILGAIFGLFSMDSGITVLCALIGGIIGAVLAYAAYLLVVFLSCFGTGVLLGTVLMISSGNYSGIVIGAVMCGLLIGVLGVLLTKTMITLQTTIEGALWIGIGFSLLTYNVSVALFVMVLFFGLGLVIQSRNGGEKVTIHTPKADNGKIIVPEVIEPVPQETVQSEPRDMKKEIQDMAQNARRVAQEKASTLWEMLKMAKDGSGKYIDIGVELGKKAETNIERGILFLQKNIEKIWDYFENNKKLFFPIMCVALVVVSVIALR